MDSGENSRSEILTIAENLLLNIEKQMTGSNNKEFSDEDLLALHSVFGAVLSRALNILEKYPLLETYSVANLSRMLIEIKGENDRRYRIFPRLNYCSCLAFKHQVVAAKSQLTCKHVLAGRIALILGKTVDHQVTREQYRMLVCSMFETQV